MAKRRDAEAAINETLKTNISVVGITAATRAGGRQISGAPRKYYINDEASRVAMYGSQLFNI